MGNAGNRGAAVARRSGGVLSPLPALTLRLRVFIDWLRTIDIINVTNTAFDYYKAYLLPFGWTLKTFRAANKTLETKRCGRGRWLGFTHLK